MHARSARSDAALRGCRCKTTANRIKTRSPAETRPWLPSAVDVSFSVHSRIGVAVISTRAITRRCMEDAASSSITFSCPSLSGRILNYWGGGESDEPTMPPIGKSVKTLNRIIRLGSARGGSRLFARNGTPFGADQPERLSAEIREIAFLRPVRSCPSAQRHGKFNGESRGGFTRSLKNRDHAGHRARAISRAEVPRKRVRAYIHARVSNRESLLGTRRDEFRVDERGGAHGPLIRRFARPFKRAFLSRWTAKGETGGGGARGSADLTGGSQSRVRSDENVRQSGTAPLTVT